MMKLGTMLLGLAFSAAVQAGQGSGVITFIGSVMVPACVLSVHVGDSPPAAEATPGVAICSAQPGAPVNAYFSSHLLGGGHAHLRKIAEVVGSHVANATYVVEYQ